MAAAQQTKKNNFMLFKRDFGPKGAVLFVCHCPSTWLTVCLDCCLQNQTLGLPMDQTVIEFVNATEDDPNNRNKCPTAHVAVADD